MIVKFLNGTEKNIESLVGADLSFADLKDVNREGVDFTRAYLTGADLRGADLNHANFREANLTCANLEGADLTYANLEGAELRNAIFRSADLMKADLTGAKMDYSTWPLWCGSIGVKVDVKIAKQLVYHAISVDCDDPEFLKIREFCKDFANGFHRVQDKDCKKV